MNFPVFDLHCDTANAILGRNAEQDKDIRENDLHIDLMRASRLPGYCQCFACFTTPFMENWGEGKAQDVFERELQGILGQLNRNQDMIRLAKSAEDIESNREAGMMSAVLTIEGPAGFDYDAARLEELHNIGFCMTTLGWNESNPLAGSHQTGGGLTEKGKEFVKEAQGLGMLIDVSHISDDAFWDIMDITQAPVVASHSNSRKVFDVSRNITDDMFKAICHTGGVAGLNLYAGFIAEDADIQAACRHILHFLELDPEGKHIALGSDFDGCDPLPKGIGGVEDYPKLALSLSQLGVSEEILRNIFWRNAIGVMENAVCNHKK